MMTRMGEQAAAGTDREPSARDLAREAGDDNTPNEQDEIQPEPITEMPDEGWLCPRCTDGSQGGAGADAREEGEDQEEPSSSRTDGDEPYEEPT